jgi:hypothetical protein
MNLTLINHSSPAFGKVLPNGIHFYEGENINFDPGNAHIDPDVNPHLITKNEDDKLVLAPEYEKRLDGDLFVAFNPETIEHLEEVREGIPEHLKNTVGEEYILANEISDKLREQKEYYTKNPQTFLDKLHSLFYVGIPATFGIGIDTLATDIVKEYPFPIMTSLLGLSGLIAAERRYLNKKNRLSYIDQAKNYIMNSK